MKRRAESYIDDALECNELLGVEFISTVPTKARPE